LSGGRRNEGPPSPRPSPPSPRAPSAPGECQGEGRELAPPTASAAARHSNPLPASGGRECGWRLLDPEADMKGLEPLIVARGVTRVLPGTVPVTLVRDIDVSIGSGELVAITGVSGSGKSSLLYLMGLLDLPTAGEVRIRDRATAHMDEPE